MNKLYPHLTSLHLYPVTLIEQQLTVLLKPGSFSHPVLKNRQEPLIPIVYPWKSIKIHPKHYLSSKKNQRVKHISFAPGNIFPINYSTQRQSCMCVFSAPYFIPPFVCGPSFHSMKCWTFHCLLYRSHSSRLKNTPPNSLPPPPQSQFPLSQPFCGFSQCFLCMFWPFIYFAIKSLPVEHQPALF